MKLKALKVLKYSNFIWKSNEGCALKLCSNEGEYFEGDAVSFW
jgi:hypothetical protein